MAIIIDCPCGAKIRAKRKPKPGAKCPKCGEPITEEKQADPVPEQLPPPPPPEEEFWEPRLVDDPLPAEDLPDESSLSLDQAIAHRKARDKRRARTRRALDFLSALLIIFIILQVVGTIAYMVMLFWWHSDPIFVAMGSLGFVLIQLFVTVVVWAVVTAAIGTLSLVCDMHEVVTR